ncbi:MAG: oligosaccharide biosynthesis protein Alg14 [Bacteroidetes bacterium HGW-Bacteroidetes-11]|jgi:UDP-N-acetylglucosamine:LPS N-acetylglucosamine transferase|nr:MAG: oligosaccharide biosynthesis protein Alg14 [Bacteroidetes bacterium HGW-Bacteroidetes-11]
MTGKPKKILAVASGGGHWIQLMRLKPAFEGCDLVYLSTHDGYKKLVQNSRFYKVTDANRWNKLKLLKMAFEVRKVVIREKPDVIISTGAAPGLFAILWGRLSGSKTIWLDSIANVEKLSMSGRIVKPFAHLHLTQWEHLASNSTLFKGNVIS